MSQHLHSDFKIRIPDDLKEKIRQSADKLNRSMTADIVARLEGSFENETKPHTVSVDINPSEDWIEQSGLTHEQVGEVLKRLAFERMAQIVREEKADTKN